MKHNRESIQHRRINPHPWVFESSFLVGGVYGLFIYLHKNYVKYKKDKKVEKNSQTLTLSEVTDDNLWEGNVQYSSKDYPFTTRREIILDDNIGTGSVPQ